MADSPLIKPGYRIAITNPPEKYVEDKSLGRGRT
jgi:hypothetical protein